MKLRLLLVRTLVVVSIFTTICCVVRGYVNTNDIQKVSLDTQGNEVQQDCEVLGKKRKVVKSVRSVKPFELNPSDNYMLGLLNDLRTKNKVGLLVADEDLTNKAQIRAQEASVFWSHTRPDGTQGVDMISRNKWAGENLSYVVRTGVEQQDYDIMFAELSASPTHLDNMIFSKFTKVGIAHYENNGTLYVAYMFSS